MKLITVLRHRAELLSFLLDTRKLEREGVLQREDRDTDKALGILVDKMYPYGRVKPRLSWVRAKIRYHENAIRNINLSESYWCEESRNDARDPHEEAIHDYRELEKDILAIMG